MDNETFIGWLIDTHLNTKDRRGDLAKDVYDERRKGYRVTDYNTYRKHLIRMKACEGAIETVDICFKEYDLGNY